MMQVVLPWPPKELSPNARQHWAALARVKKQYRTACWALTRQAMAEAGMASGAPKNEVHLVFVPPDRRNRDADNMLASMKAGLDGLADALKANDSKFKVTFDVSDDIGGMVKVSVIPMKDPA